VTIVMTRSCTDLGFSGRASPLDGLNKPIGYADLIAYQQSFDRLSQQQVC
jgi:hypothetical protein